MPPPAGAAAVCGARHELAALPGDAEEARAVERAGCEERGHFAEAVARDAVGLHADRVEERELRGAHGADRGLRPLGGAEVLLGGLAIRVREDRTREDDLVERDGAADPGARLVVPHGSRGVEHVTRGLRPSTRTGCPDRRRRSAMPPSAACSEKKIAPGTANVGALFVSSDFAACSRRLFSSSPSEAMTARRAFADAAKRCCDSRATCARTPGARRRRGELARALRDRRAVVAREHDELRGERPEAQRALALAGVLLDGDVEVRPAEPERAHRRAARVVSLAGSRAAAPC